jgi:hypothetical protein
MTHADFLPLLHAVHAPRYHDNDNNNNPNINRTTIRTSTAAWKEVMLQTVTTATIELMNACYIYKARSD